MAIKVAGIEVISDAKRFKNISSTSGAHGELHSTTSAITSAITFTGGIQNCIMTAAQTFTISGADEGISTALLLDTTAASHDPTFPSSMVFVGGEPTWANSRYWQIGILSKDSYQVATSIGYAGSSPTEAVTLEGTSGSPMSFTAFTGTSPMQAGWRFKADGNVYKYNSPNNSNGSGEALHSTTTWNNITPTFNTGVNPANTWYIRFTDHSGTAPTQSISSNFNTWQSLNTTRGFEWYNSNNPNSYGDISGVVKVEIGYVAGGGAPSTISATGYYQLRYIGTA